LSAAEPAAPEEPAEPPVPEEPAEPPVPDPAAPELPEPPAPPAELPALPAIVLEVSSPPQADASAPKNPRIQAQPQQPLRPSSSMRAPSKVFEEAVSVRPKWPLCTVQRRRRMSAARVLVCSWGCGSPSSFPRTAWPAGCGSLQRTPIG